MIFKDHNLFLDDSGTKEYAESYRTDGGPTPFFAFGGLLVTPAVAGYLQREMRSLKQACFGRPDVEIKANWLRVDYERKRRYLDMFGISEKGLNELSEGIYTLLGESDCMLFSCVVNKKEVQHKYVCPWYAPAIAYDCVLQRVQMQMAERDGRAHVTIDDMSGATPKRRQYKENLTRQHKLLRTHGSRLWPGFTFERIGSQKFSDSKSDERLQLADLVAYAVYRQFVEHGEEWETKVDELPTYSYLGKLARRFCQSETGIIAGYGIVKFPMNEKKRWGVSPEKSP